METFLDLYTEFRIYGLLTVLFALTLYFLFQIKRKTYASEIPLDESLDLDEEQALTGALQFDRKNFVLELEQLRVDRNYKPGWLYYRCKEKGYLTEYYALRKSGQIEDQFKRTPTESPSPTKEPKLSIELVPSSCWYSNLRSVLEPPVWKKVKQIAYKKAQYRCEICGGRGPKWPVEAHELWHYEEKTLTQVLNRIISLCPACHEVKHFGLADIKGRSDEALHHLMKINEWTEEIASNYVEAQFEVWSKRSMQDWVVNLKVLSAYGISDEEILKYEKMGNEERVS